GGNTGTAETAGRGERGRAGASLGCRLGRRAGARAAPLPGRQPGRAGGAPGHPPTDRLGGGDGGQPAPADGPPPAPPGRRGSRARWSGRRSRDRAGGRAMSGGRALTPRPSPARRERGVRQGTATAGAPLLEHELLACWLLGRVPATVMPWPLLRAGRAGRG